MENVLYLAMTAAEFRENSLLASPIAWMACHFSPYSTALSNLPRFLPKGSLLMVNDRTPVFGHDPALIAAQLAHAAEHLQCSGILLDLQRPAEPQTLAIAKAVAALPCPVGVTPPYAEDVDCAVFLPPVPLTTRLEDHLVSWQHREIWLEVATEQACFRVSRDDCRETEWKASDLSYPHTDAALFCQYQMDVQEDHIDFFLQRDNKMLSALMEEGKKLGVSRFVGLYQQLGASFSQPMAQETARSQA